MIPLGELLTMEALEADPDPLLARLRAEAPVCWAPALDMWLVTRWDDVEYVEAHPELFTAATEPSFLARTLGQNMLTSDPPELTRIREIMLPPFRAGGRSGEFVSAELPGLADSLIDGFPTGKFDLMTQYAQPLSAQSLALVLGLDEFGFDRMWKWCEGLCTDLANFENDPELAAVGERTKHDLGKALAERLAQGTDDDSAISWFVRHGASAEEVINNVRLMISGGINEPRDGIGLVVWVLLTRPDLRAEIEADPRLMRRLVEEVFRLFSPVGTATRQATADVQLAGTQIRAGDLVAAVLRSANLDEDHWLAPTEIDLHRKQGPHAAFALGAHRCLGEWLGRQEVKVGAERLFAKLPNLRLDSNHKVEVYGFEFRGPRELWVTAGGRS
ncbi:MAG: cytochrome P450 [Actinobacteria bacterium]|nr:cytochrome P450 [Actinomycetota bacterium]